MHLDAVGRRLSLNPRDPAFYQDPYAAYRRVRSEAPVVYWREFDRWCFFSHRDVSAVLRDRRFGRSLEGVDGVEAAAPTLDVDRFSMLEMEPPSHTRLRRLVQGAFIARRIETLRPRIEQLCHELIDGFEDRGRVDLLPAFATPIPVVVITELLGVPTSMGEQLLDWSHAMVAVYELDPSAAQISDARSAADDFVRFLREYVAKRRLDPRDDLLTQLIQAEEEGERLSEDELIATCILLLNAGHEATVNVIGNGTLALLRHRGQLERWRQDPGLTATAIEELLRFDTPLHLFNRYALEDISIGGVELRAGQEVSLLLGSANRDPEAFDDAESLDLGRARNPQISFGAGLHYCVGAPLARLELQTAFPILLERLEDVELDDEPRFKNSYHFRGLESLRVRF
ncbi:MAG: cytochrome P450 [Acidobacteriota bacterium]